MQPRVIRLHRCSARRDRTLAAAAVVALGLAGGPIARAEPPAAPPEEGPVGLDAAIDASLGIAE